MTRSCLVTGGSRGIGKAIAAALVKRGYKVVTPARSELDLTSAASVRAYLSALTEQIDVLVNCAGQNTINEIPKVKFEDWERMMQINVTTPFMMIQALVPKMAERGFGRVVNISSIYGQKSRPGRSVYSATKCAIESLARSVSVEYSAAGVLANSVSPGFVDTDLTRQNNNEAQLTEIKKKIAMGRMASENEIASAVAFLVSDENTYLTGQNIYVDGGFTIL